jgi:hypothetical protein
VEKRQVIEKGDDTPSHYTVTIERGWLVLL